MQRHDGAIGERNILQRALDIAEAKLGRPRSRQIVDVDLEILEHNLPYHQVNRRQRCGGHRCRAGCRSGRRQQREQIDRAVLFPPDHEVAASQRDAADAGFQRDPIGVDSSDLQRRQFDGRLAVPALGDPEVAQAQPAIGQLEHPAPGGKFRLIVSVDGELARRDIGVCRLVGVGRVLRQIEILDAEFTRGGNRIGAQRSGPGEALPSLRHGLEMIRSAAIPGGAEFSQRKADRTDDCPERSLAAVVGEINTRPGDPEAIDQDRSWGFGGRRLDGHRGNFGQQIGEVERAILIDRDM